MLLRFLVGLLGEAYRQDSKEPGQMINVLAHSQGTVVTSMALNMHTEDLFSLTDRANFAMNQAVFMGANITEFALNENELIGNLGKYHYDTRILDKVHITNLYSKYDLAVGANQRALQILYEVAISRGLKGIGSKSKIGKLNPTTNSKTKTFVESVSLDTVYATLADVTQQVFPDWADGAGHQGFKGHIDGVFQINAATDSNYNPGNVPVHHVTLNFVNHVTFGTVEWIGWWDWLLKTPAGQSNTRTINCKFEIHFL